MNEINRKLSSQLKFDLSEYIIKILIYFNHFFFPPSNVDSNNQYRGEIIKSDQELMILANMEQFVMKVRGGNWGGRV